ncbi:hypothetical protein RDWZM_003280 [Blomia tropicalis]|uniref:Putative hydroxypyruvate isomerase n=1 Tax=Blomia tropicalis TaxID=40697 RepID=A0A9Q0MJ92_BLOTA|nr:hypothetical protein RDWZM_003280 [Blomia tropicalis]
MSTMAKTSITKSVKFAANISSLFLDIPDHIESYHEILKRKDYQFKAVEAQDPYKVSVDDWKKELNSVETASKPEFVLINSPPLFQRFPDRFPTVEEFDSILKITGDYVTTLNARKVHLLLSDVNNSNDMTEMKQLLVKGARYLAKLNVTCLIEPLSTRPNYYLRSYDVALQLINELNEPNLKIMFDTYHLQRLHGNILHYLELLKNHIGHVQISQIPLRDCPIDEGELNHDFILKKLSTIYDDYIGLEYFNYATDNFEWVKKYTTNAGDEK